MEDILITEIIKTCLAIDSIATRIYARFSKSSDHPDLKIFWERMATEERNHVRFWKELSELSEKGIIPQVFESPEQVLSDIKKIESRTRTLLEQSLKRPDITACFLIAYRLEFYALHPAFEALFQSAGHVDRSGFNPVEEYEQHINRFIDAMNKYGTITPEIELLGESLQRLWKNNRILSRLSSMDELTGVLNRRGFFSLAKPFIHLAWRNRYQVGIMMIDLDHFKAVNDKYGHQAGDRVLSNVALILKENVRPYDILGRYGGEEFILLATSLSPDSLLAMAEKLRSKVEEITRQNIAVTISIGASYGWIKKDVDKEMQELIEHADKCLYDAKKAGRNRLICTTEPPHGSP